MICFNLLSRATVHHYSSATMVPLFALFFCLLTTSNAKDSSHIISRTRRGTDTKDPAVIKEILDIHNKLRAKQPATSMFELTWEPDAAIDGAKWLEKCEFRHPTEPADLAFIQPKKPGTGQNLYAMMGLSVADDWTSAVNSWYEEIKDFKLGGPNEFLKVGHYTQVMWNDTYSVGCAYRLCPNNHHYYVCNYYPAGNLGPDYPFEPGQACQKCPNNCRNGLCTNPCKVYDDSSDCESLFPNGCPSADKLSAQQKETFPKCKATCQCKPLGLLISKWVSRGGADRTGSCCVRLGWAVVLLAYAVFG